MLRKTVLFACIAALLLSLSGPAAAHKTVETPDETLRITWGFLNEPAATWTKTGLDIILRDHATGEGIPGAVAMIEAAELRWGEQELPLDLAPQHGREDEGRYTSQVITLTQGGIYVLYLKGEYDGTPFELEIPSAHEILDISESFFPAVPANPFSAGSGGDTAALEAQIAQLTARVDALEAEAATQAKTPADTTTDTNPTPGLSPALMLGMLVAVAALLAFRGRT